MGQPRGAPRGGDSRRQRSIGDAVDVVQLQAGAIRDTKAGRCDEGLVDGGKAGDGAGGRMFACRLGEVIVGRKIGQRGEGVERVDDGGQDVQVGGFGLNAIGSASRAWRSRSYRAPVCRRLTTTGIGIHGDVHVSRHKGVVGLKYWQINVVVAVQPRTRYTGCPMALFPWAAIVVAPVAP